MMAKKSGTRAPPMHMSLEDLVLADHFYRHLEQILDVSFVHEVRAPLALFVTLPTQCSGDVYPLLALPGNLARSLSAFPPNAEVRQSARAAMV